MKTRKQPMRRCVGCMESKPKKELLRIVYTPEGELKYDATGKVNGRGVYLCNNKECIEKAQKRGSIPRGLNREIDKESLDLLFDELTTGENKG